MHGLLLSFITVVSPGLSHINPKETRPEPETCFLVYSLNYATSNLNVYESFAIYQSKTIFTPLFSVQNCAWYSGLNFGNLLRRTGSVHGKNVQTFCSLRS